MERGVEALLSLFVRSAEAMPAGEWSWGASSALGAVVEEVQHVLDTDENSPQEDAHAHDRMQQDWSSDPQRTQQRMGVLMVGGLTILMAESGLLVNPRLELLVRGLVRQVYLCLSVIFPATLLACVLACLLTCLCLPCFCVDGVDCGTKIA